MANSKQRRRREKEKRHGIEIVEIDEEGNERVLDSSALKPAAPPARVKGKGSSPAAAKSSSRGGTYREVKPPSWSRALKRAGIFGPIFLVFFLVVKPEKTGTAAVVIQALAMIALFVPMSYYMDRFAYRAYQKRLAKGSGR
jgi:hypothetical protein